MAFTIASPAPPVLQSDTFEIQRQKINNLYNAIANGGGIKQWTWLAQPKIIWIGSITGWDASPTFGVLRGAFNAAATGFSGQTGLGNFTLASNVYDWRNASHDVYNTPIDSGFLNLTTTLGVTPAAVELYYLAWDDTDNLNGQATYVQNSSSTIIKMSLENAGGIIARNANLSTPDGTIRIYRDGDADLLGSVIAVTGYYA